MVVVENLLYILDTEVSSLVALSCLILKCLRFKCGSLCVFLCSQDVLSLWDLHFLVMIHCWPDLAIHDFELTTECGSASIVAYVLMFYNTL